MSNFLRVGIVTIVAILAAGAFVDRHAALRFRVASTIASAERLPVMTQFSARRAYGLPLQVCESGAGLFNLVG